MVHPTSYEVKRRRYLVVYGVLREKKINYRLCAAIRSDFAPETTWGFALVHRPDVFDVIDDVGWFLVQW